VDSFTIFAEDGEYAEEAPGIEAALAQFRARRPGLFVGAVVNDAMRPSLTLEDEASGEQPVSFPPDPPSARWEEFHRNNPGLHSR
jgi:hypothetical protein